MAIDPKSSNPRSRADARTIPETTGMETTHNFTQKVKGQKQELNAAQQIYRAERSAVIQKRAKEFSPEQAEKIPRDSIFSSSIPHVDTLTLNPGTKLGTVDVRVHVETKDGAKEFDLTCNPKITTGPFRPFPADIARLSSTIQEDLLKEVLDAAEVLKITWYEIPGELIASDIGSGTPKEINFDTSQGEKDEDLDASERIHFLTGISGIAYPFRGAKGFLGYHGVALEDGTYVIDHPQKNNAAYVGDGLPPFSHDGDREAQITSGLQEAARLFVGRTRAELQEMGAVQIRHQGAWQERITSAIERVRAARTAKKQAK